MRRLVSRVDRLQRLAVFDAAARTGSFTAAAAELSTSQPAVTRQIRELELALGITLFDRSANRSTLTDAGRTLAASTDAAFAAIEWCLTDLDDPDPMFVLAAPPGFAQQLLVPVLDRLHDALPDVDIRLWLYDRDDELDTGNYDMAIRVGSGSWPDIEDLELFPERVLPVASAVLAERLGLNEASTPPEVLAAPLLHMETGGRPWMSWNEWFEAFDLRLAPEHGRAIHNSYPTLLQRALAGGGLALGWRSIVDQLVDDGLLVVVGPEVASDRSYRLTWPTAPKDDERLRLATDWLLTTIEARPADD